MDTIALIEALDELKQIVSEKQDNENLKEKCDNIRTAISDAVSSMESAMSELENLDYSINEAKSQIEAARDEISEYCF
jgi:chromosome segregation ATPase